jgi:RNA polymerase sigma-70 factor, ECF subfamily
MRDTGTYHALGVAILTVTTTGIAGITVFGGGPDLVAKFVLPPIHPASRTPADS